MRRATPPFTGIVMSALEEQMDLDYVLQAPLRLAERDLLEAAVVRIASAFLDGGRLWAIGNGGSHAQATHFCAELAVRFSQERPHWPAIALPTDLPALTALGNDYPEKQAMSRQVLGHVGPGDVLVGFTTSNSPNVIGALVDAEGKGATTILITGPLPRTALPDCTILNVVDDDGPEVTTAQIQVAHLIILHILACALDKWSVGLDSSA